MVATSEESTVGDFEWDEQLTEDEQSLAASLAHLTSVRYGAVVTESARIRRLQVESGGGPERPIRMPMPTPVGGPPDDPMSINAV